MKESSRNSHRSTFAPPIVTKVITNPGRKLLHRSKKLSGTDKLVNLSKLNLKDLNLGDDKLKNTKHKNY